MIYAEERYNNIMRLLTDKGRISSAELSSALNISRETIRRDLNRLAQEGRLVKTRGGAILPELPPMSAVRIGEGGKQQLLVKIGLIGAYLFL